MTTIIEKHLPLLLKAQSLIGFGCWEWNVRAEAVFWTEGMFAIFGLPVAPGDHISINEINKLIHPDDLPNIKRKWEEMKAGKSSDFRFRIITLQQEIKYLQFTSETINDKRSGILVRGICRDITREKATLDVVIETKDELELELKTFLRAEQVAGSGTWRIDLNTHEAFYSDKVFRLYGLLPQSLPTHLNTFNAFIHPEERSVQNATSCLHRFWHKITFIQNDTVILHLNYRSI